MSNGHQRSGQENWGGESQGLWEMATAPGRASSAAPNTLSPELAVCSAPQGFLANRNARVDLEAQAQGSPHLLRTVPSLLPLLDLQQGDGHAHFCRSSVPAPRAPGEQQVEPAQRVQGTSHKDPAHGGLGGGGSVRCPLPNPPVPAPRQPAVTCASPGLPRGTLPPALSMGDWRLWAASAAL